MATCNDSRLARTVRDSGKSPPNRTIPSRPPASRPVVCPHRKLVSATFMRESQESGNVRDIYRLAGVAASLNSAARELCRTADVDPNDGAAVANPYTNQQLPSSCVRSARCYSNLNIDIPSPAIAA
jgi:hypothetical protein